jgi:hypothetical protein
MTEFVPQRFRERSPVVEAVQLTGDADWDAIAELAEIISVEYQQPEPRERVVQRIASAASVLAACRQESDVQEITPGRLAALRDAIRFGKGGPR